MINKLIKNLNRLLNFVKGDTKIVITFVAIVVTFVIIILGRINIPKPETTTPGAPFKVKPEQQVEWEQVTPGITSYTQAKDKFNNYEGRSKYQKLSVHEHGFDDENFYYSADLGTNKDNIVEYILLEVNSYEKLPFAQYKDKLDLKDVDIIKEDRYLAYHNVYVYLDKGLLLGVRRADQKVAYEMYFEPMSESEFMTFWGANLTDKFEFPDDKMR